MIFMLIAAAEIGFWVVLVAGLVARYPLRRPRLGGWLLLGVPLVDVVLLAAVATDLAGGAEPSAGHGLAACYLGFTIAYGRSVIRWADARFAHRYAGGPKPPKPPKKGWARTTYEWRGWCQTLLATVISLAVLQLLVVLADGTGDSQDLLVWQLRMLVVLGVHTIVALCYTTLPGRPSAEESAPGGDPAPARPADAPAVPAGRTPGS